MTARYEPVVIRREVVTSNPDGDPITSGWVDHLTLEAKFAPSNPGEPSEIGRDAVITGGVVYVRDLSSRPDITAYDRVVIRGVEYPIDGEIGAWLREDMWAVQFAVKLAKG